MEVCVYLMTRHEGKGVLFEKNTSDESKPRLKPSFQRKNKNAILTAFSKAVLGLLTNHISARKAQYKLPLTKEDSGRSGKLQSEF